MLVYDREKKACVEAPEVGSGAIRFAYGTAFGRLLTRAILCRAFVSRLYGAWQKSCLSRGKVKKFMATYHITAEDCTTRDFPNFNAFFTRQRKTYQDLCKTPLELPAIADSKLTACPIDDDTLLQVKGVPYTVAQLLQDEALAADYKGGMCLIFRLCPDDYHRYVYPDSGRQGPVTAIRGVLHTVNPIAGTLGVYRRNARRHCLLETDHFGRVIQMEVGALLVGRICNHNEGETPVQRLQEKGYFEYGGSTVILLLRPGRVQIDEDLLAQSRKGIETKVRLGERIGVAL